MKISLGNKLKLVIIVTAICAFYNASAWITSALLLIIIFLTYNIFQHLKAKEKEAVEQTEGPYQIGKRVDEVSIHKVKRRYLYWRLLIIVFLIAILAYGFYIKYKLYLISKSH